MKSNLNSTLSRCAVIAFLGGVCACSLAAGEPDDSGSLAGPKVESGSTASSKATLVERDFDGKVRRLEISPEEAAIRMLKLDVQTQSKVNDVIGSRARTLDTFVKENLDLLLKFATASAANNKQDQGMLLREVYEKAEPIRKEGRLLDTVGAVLPKEQKAEFTRLVQGYYKALIDEEEANARKGMDEAQKERKPGRAGLVMKVGFEQFGQDIKRSYERVIAEGQGKLDEFIKHLELSPEQDQKVRKLTADFAIAHIKTPATETEKTLLFFAISAELQPEQRAKLLQYVKQNK